MAMPNPDAENPIPNSLRGTVLCTAVAGDFNTEYNLHQLEEFILVHESELGTARRDADVMVQGTKANIGWMAEHYETILSWLPNNTQAAIARTVKA